MAGVSHHSWDLETEVPTVLTRATVADGKYIQKDTIDPLINRDEALKSWLEDTGDELVRVSGELMDTISSVSSTLDTKIDTTSAALHNEITATSASLHEELTAASADLYNQTTAVSSNLYTSLTSTSSTLNTKIDTASGNIMSDMKTSADNLILYTNSASAYVQGNLQTSADNLVSALNDLDTEFNEYLSALSANVSSNYVQKGKTQNVGEIAVWESVSDGLKVSGRSIETQATNITVDGSSSTFIPTVGAVAGAIDNKVAGLFKFKGSETVAKINGLSTPSEGDVYNVSDNGTITYGEKSNMPVSAGDNIVWVKPTAGGNGYWDKMAAAFDDSNCMKKVSPVTVNDIATFGSDGQVNDSGKSVSTAAPVNTSTDNTLPTSFAVYKAISGFASKVPTTDAGEILVASTGGDLSGSDKTITTSKPGAGSTDATVPTSRAVSGAIYDATTGKLDKFSNETAGNVVVVNPDGTNLSASNYTLGASIPTPVAANKVLKTNDSNVPTWVDETTFTPVLNSKTASGYVAAGDTYNNIGGAWVVDDGFYHENSQWYTDGPDIGKPKWGRIGKIKKISIRGGTIVDPTDITYICHGRSFIYCLGPDSNVNGKSYVKIVLSDALDEDVIQLHFPNNNGGTLTIENKYGGGGYIKARGATTPIADNGTYTIDFPSNALVAVGRYNKTVMICEGGAGGAGGDVVTYYVNDGNQGPTFAEVNAALDAHKLVFIRSRNGTIFTYWGWHRFISNEGLSYVFCAPLLHTNSQYVKIPTLYVSSQSEVHTRDDGTQYTYWHSMDNTLPVLHTFTTQTTASEVFQSGISSIPVGIYQFCDDGCIYEFSKYEYEDHLIITFTHTFEDGSVASWVGEQKWNAASESEMVWTKHADSALPFTVIYRKTPMKDMVDAYKAGRPFVFKLSEVTLLATPCLSYAVTENSFNCIVGNSLPVFGWNPGQTVYPEMYYHYSYNNENGEWHYEQQKVENIIRTDSSYVTKGQKYAATGQAGLGSFLFSVGSESENTIDQTIFINSNNTDSSVRYTYDYAEVSLNGILEITIKASSNGEFPIVIDYQKAKSNGSSTPPFVLLSDNSPRYTLHNGTNIIPFNWTYKIRYSEIANDDYDKLFKTPTNYYPSKLWIGFDTSDKTPEKVEELEPVDSYSYVKTQVYNMHTKVYLHNVTSVRTIS